MSESGNMQLSSLGWVKDEVNKSLEGACASLEAYVENGDPADKQGLQNSLELIKQVRGTLQMVQLQGALLLTEEIIHLLEALKSDSEKIPDRDRAYEALMRAMLQLPDYFSKVQSGQADAAIILLPLINDLRSGYGEVAVVAEALFAPHFDGILPPEMPDITAFDGGDLAVFIKGTRHKIHLAMLSLFRGKETEQSLNRLIQIYLKCCVSAHTDSAKQLYWIASALCEGIRDGGLDMDALPVKPLLGQIDRQSKIIIDGGEEGLEEEKPDELIRILLYYVACSSKQGEILSELKSQFKLDEYLPDEEELEKLRAKLAGPSAEVIETVIQGITHELDRARDMLDIYTRTGEQDNERLQQLVQSLRNAAGTIAMIGDLDLQKSINEYCENIEAVIAGSKSSEEVAISNIADFILHIDDGVQALRPESAEVTAEKAKSSLAGSTGVWDVRRAVVKESAANMSTCKDIIAEYVQSTDFDDKQLEAVADLLQQIAGSLRIAQLERASDIIYTLRSFIDKELVQASKALNESELESLAEAISSADYYLEAVIDELPNKETALDLAEAALDLLGYGNGSIDEELEELADVEPVEDNDAEIQIEDDSSLLDSIAEDLQEEYGEGEDEGADGAFELDPESIEKDEEESRELDDVSLDESVAEVDEDEADVEEIEIAPPEESEEEMSMRLAADAETADLGELPSIEAVEEPLDEGIEELSADAMMESEEDMLARIEENAESPDDLIPDSGDIEVDDLDSQIEEVDLEAAEEAAEEAEPSTEDQDNAEPGSSIQVSLMNESPLGDDLDEEIVEIFLEEAEEVLGALREHFPIWSDDQDNLESLTVIRRSFHTFKGSGRMVGAIQIGEFSWAIENLLNKVIDSSIKATPEVLDVIRKAIDVLPTMVGQLTGGPAPEIDIVALSSLADTLAAGKSGGDAGGADEQTMSEPTASTKIKIQNLVASDEDASSHSGLFGDSSVSMPLDSDELREVYTEETNLHLAGLESFIERCRDDSNECFLHEQQILIFHTLHGGSATVGADALKAIFDVLEPLAILLKENNIKVEEPLLKFYERTIAQARQFLAEINGSDEPFVPDTDLLNEIQNLLQETKEFVGAVTGSFSILDSMSDNSMSTATPVSDDGALEEISSSLEDLRDLMSSDTESDDAALELVTAEAVLEDDVELEETSAALDEYEPESLTAEAMTGDDVELEETSAALDEYEPESLTAEAMTGDDVELEEASAALDEYEPESLTAEAMTGDDVELEEASAALDEYEPESLTAEAMTGDDVELEEASAALDEYEPESLTAEAMTGDDVELEETSAALNEYEPELSVPETIEAETASTEADSKSAGDDVDLEIMDIFLEEAAELLSTIEQSLDDWQNDWTNQNLMISILREIHTLKGGARMVNQTALSDIGHAMETLLTAVEAGRVEVSEDMFSVLHVARDTLQDLFEDLKQGKYNAPTNAQLVLQLEAMHHVLPAQEHMQVSGGDADVQEDVDDYDEVSSGFDLLDIFMEEAGELLEAIDQTLDDWQGDEDNSELAIQVQRDIHTLKGGARMVNLRGIGDLGHAMETLLTAIVDGHIEATKPFFDGMHQVKDELQTMYEKARSGNGDSEVSSESLELLKSLHYDDETESVTEDVAQIEDEVTPSFMLPALDEDSALVTLEDSGSFEVTPSESMTALEDSGSFEVTPSESMAALEDSGSFEVTPSESTTALEDSDSFEVTPSESMTALEDTGNFEVTPSGTMASLDDDGSTLTQLVAKAEKQKKKDPSGKDKRTSARVEHETVRVRSDLIDGLVNLAGETNIFRSRLEQQSGSFRFSLGELDQTVIRLQNQLKKLDMETEAQILFRHEKELDDPDNENFDPLEMDRYSTLQQLSRSLVESVGDLNSLQDMLGGLTRDTELLLLQQGRVNSELQDRLMQARVVPFAATMASRLRRITRQTCQQLHKQAELKIIGANEEMDRHILDRMVAPLEHMLRNSIAHGIEDPEVRKSRGKPESGTVTVSVGREGGEIVIQVADDGGGLDTDAIRRKAESKDLIVKNADMTDDEVMQLVLTPGFSTADSVSQISGRGVGMDVVNNEIRQLNGSLHIESVIERGAAMTVRLPFSLSIAQALLAGVGQDLYAIPLTSIEGVARIDREEAEKLINDKDSRYKYGGEEYRISSLGSLLGRTQGSGENSDARPAVIFVRAGGHRVGFYVDELQGHHEVVVKSLGAQISTIVGLAGGTILGDGRVALILDVPALVRMVSAEQGYEVEEPVLPEEEELPDTKLTVMVVDDSITVRRVTTRVLERHDMEVVTAKDGVEAVAILEETIPDIMLLDVEMPRMDGYELATHMRNDSRYKNIPIIMITSRTGAKHRDRAMAIGVDRYLGKPYQEMDLLNNINQVLEERRSA